jgi:hypothetical protein
VEGQQVLDAISKFGRSFSLLRIPFALKLMIQELQVMNIQMRIITEENIDQLTNLSFQSRNIDKLLYIDHGEDGSVERDIKEIIENYKKDMESKINLIDTEKRQSTVKSRYQENIEPQVFEETPIPESVSPQYPSEESPAYEPNSDELNSSASSDYVPGSPNNVPEYGTPDFPPPSKLESEEEGLEGGTINIFSDPNMNASFNMLGGGAQSKLLMMDPTQRQIVMQQIIRESGKQQMDPLQTNSTQSNSVQNKTGTVLNEYFSKLPMRQQMDALKGGYGSVSKEFSQLASKVSNPLVTIVKPVSIQEQLSSKLPLLSVDQKGGVSTESETNQTNSDNNSSSSENNSSDSGTTKKISFN